MSLTNQHIDALIVLCKQGNQLAQLEVYNRYQQAMFNVSHRIVKDTAEAEDIMQESFITAFSKIDSFKGDATFGSWLKRIVINNSLTQYRSSSRYTKVSDENITDTTVMDHETSYQEDYSAIRAKQMMECMDQLHPSYSNILTLHFIEGYDYEELCDILDISYANCRTMLSRAKTSLRKKLSIAV